jgi:hypothetical protein
MSTKKLRSFVVRGLEQVVDDKIKPRQYNCLGTMKDLSIYKEKVVSSLPAAISLLSKSSFGTNGSEFTKIRSEVDPNFTLILSTDYTNTEDQPEYIVYTLGFSFKKLADNEVPNDFKSGMRDALLTWAEKSRVIGMRGWRNNAVQEPRIEKKDDVYNVSLSIAVSTAIYYKDSIATIIASAPAQFESYTRADIKNLSQFLSDNLNRPVTFTNVAKVAA